MVLRRVGNELEKRENNEKDPKPGILYKRKEMPIYFFVYYQNLQENSELVSIHTNEDEAYDVLRSLDISEEYKWVSRVKTDNKGRIVK